LDATFYLPGPAVPRSAADHAAPGIMISVPEVDDDQLAALRRLRAAFGPIELIQVISTDPINEASMVDPRRMTLEEHGEAHAPLIKAVSDPAWHAACQALDGLLRKLLVLNRLLEAEERLAEREPPAEPPQRRQLRKRSLQ
jgi:hypothetical protein